MRVPCKIVKDELTAVEAEAVVVPANPDFDLTRGIAGAVARIAGVEQITQALAPLATMQPGDVAITQPFAYNARVLVHAMGPTWVDGNQGEDDVLYITFIRALEVAHQFGAQSIALPLISAVTRQYPPSLAFPIAVSAARDFLSRNDMDIKLVLTGSTPLLARPLDYYDIVAYLHENCDPEGSIPDYDPSYETGYVPLSFSQRLDRALEESPLSEDEIRRGANMDPDLFWEVTSMANYFPSKREVFALALALQLDLRRTLILLSSAHLTLSHKSKFDVIVEYFLKQGVYDIHAVNAALSSFDQPQL